MASTDPFQYANADVLTEQIWVGGDLEIFDEPLAEAQLAELAEAGLTHVLDVRLEWDDLAWVAERRPDVQYVHLGVDDAGQRMPDAWFDEGTAMASEALDDPEARLYVHCHMGINRGPSMAFAILLDQGWDPLEALERLRRARSIAYVAYAEDAVDWSLRRQSASEEERLDWQKRLGQWRRENGLDLESVVRRMRVRDEL